jgi:prepilin-type N-terminal cleavage/methylation domain-containing protein
MDRKGFSLIELLVVIAIIAIIVAIAVPNYLKARISAEETAATGAITTIHTAQAQYLSSKGEYATSLQQLGAADLIDRPLASGQKRGYRFTLQPSTLPSSAGYTVSAAPKHYGVTGDHTYYSERPGVIHEHEGREPAGPDDPLQGEKTSTPEQ